MHTFILKIWILNNNISYWILELIFARNGVLDISPYCVVLLAHDETIRNSNIKSANATICLTTDINKVYSRPTALALHSSFPNPLQKKSNRNRKYFITADDLPSGSSSATIKALMGNISYPSEIIVKKMSPNMTRVAQPFNMIQLMNEPNITFSIAVDSLKAFDVTPRGGIIYVRDPEPINRAIPGIY